jgi:Cu2+-exporting ATPase
MTVERLAAMKMDEPKVSEQVNHDDHAHGHTDHAMHEQTAEHTSHEHMDHAMHGQADQHAGHSGHTGHVDHSGHEQILISRFWI